MNNIDEEISNISKTLVSKSTVKQITYRNLIKYFHLIEKVAGELLDQIHKGSLEKDKDILLGIERKSDNELHLTIAGDTIIFVLHSNIIAFEPEFGYNKTSYVLDNENRKFLGRIDVYNFTSDSIRFKRISDPGYLIARILINFEGHFLIEGERQLHFLYENVSEGPMNEVDIRNLLILMIKTAIDQDLMIPPFAEIRLISLQELEFHAQSLGGANKIGFQLTHEGQKNS